MSTDETQGDVGKIILIWVTVIAIAVFLNWDSVATSVGVKSSDGTTCVDATSYDQNWNNDMKCTRPDGSTFYTSYDGASKYR